MYLFEFSLKKGGGTGGWYYPHTHNKKIKKFQKKNKNFIFQYNKNQKISTGGSKFISKFK